MNQMRDEKFRYVEMTYELPGEVLTQFHACVTQTRTPNEAVEEGRKSVLSFHPNATNVEEFLQRVITADKAEEIKTKFRTGTWDGWPLGAETR